MAIHAIELNYYIMRKIRNGRFEFNWRTSRCVIPSVKSNTDQEMINKFKHFEIMHYQSIFNFILKMRGRIIVINNLFNFVYNS